MCKILLEFYSCAESVAHYISFGLFENSTYVHNFVEGVAEVGCPHEVFFCPFAGIKAGGKRSCKNFSEVKSEACIPAAFFIGVQHHGIATTYSYQFLTHQLSHVSSNSNINSHSVHGIN